MESFVVVWGVGKIRMVALISASPCGKKKKAEVLCFVLLDPLKDLQSQCLPGQRGRTAGRTHQTNPAPLQNSTRQLRVAAKSELRATKKAQQDNKKKVDVFLAKTKEGLVGLGLRRTCKTQHEHNKNTTRTQQKHKAEADLVGFLAQLLEFGGGLNVDGEHALGVEANVTVTHQMHIKVVVAGPEGRHFGLKIASVSQALDLLQVDEVVRVLAGVEVGHQHPPALLLGLVDGAAEVGRVGRDKRVGILALQSGEAGTAEQETNGDDRVVSHNTVLVANIGLHLQG